MINEPTRVCVCASVHHPDLLDQLVRILTLDGNLVLAPVPIGRVPAPEEGAVLEHLHQARIRLADEVVALCKPDGTFGASVTAEIEYARSLNKPIRYAPLQGARAWLHHREEHQDRQGSAHHNSPSHRPQP